MPIKKSELYSSLWASCDELRGGMDASQYKDNVRDHSRGYDNLQDEFEVFFYFTINALKVVQGNFEMFSQNRCVENVFPKFVENVFPLPEPPTNENPLSLNAYEAHKKQIENYRKGVHTKWEQSNDSDPISARGTWWGAVNFVTAYVDHEMAEGRDYFAYTMFGQGDETKRKSYRLAMEALRE
jgi:hypothetical protein